MTTSITDLVRELEAERDELRRRAQALASRCEAQERVLQRAQELMRELDTYAGQVAATARDLGVSQSAPQSPHARRYSDDDVRRWRDALQAGTPIGDVAQREDVRPETILRRVRKLGPDPRPAPSPPPEKEAIVEPESPFPPLSSTNGSDVAAAGSF